MRTPIKYHPIDVPFNHEGIWYKFVKARIEAAGICYSETGENCIFIKNSPCGFKNECRTIARPDRMHAVIVRCTPSGNKPENGHILIHDRYKKILKNLGVFDEFLKEIKNGLDRLENSKTCALRKELGRGRNMSSVMYFLIIIRMETRKEYKYWDNISEMIRQREKQIETKSN